MNKPTMTAHHEEPAVEIRQMYGVLYATPGVELTVSWDQGDEITALLSLDRAYTDVKRQINGTTTIVPRPPAEDA